LLVLALEIKFVMMRNRLSGTIALWPRTNTVCYVENVKCP